MVAREKKTSEGTKMTGRIAVVLSLILASQAFAECRPSQGVVYYLDGAGGGSFLTTWAPGVKKGLAQGGFTGEFREFVWQTGLGIWADQTSSNEYKRGKAEQLAQMIMDQVQRHPNQPVSLIALSAGTAVATFTLEALPENVKVRTAILIGSSMDADYDLTEALTHVEQKMVVYTSERDQVLSLLVPMAGTADRRNSGTNIAGLVGFHMVCTTDGSTRSACDKLSQIGWRPEFAEQGDNGGHTDKTNARFVRAYLAPMVIIAHASTV